jgi:hypothetical protein
MMVSRDDALNDCFGVAPSTAMSLKHQGGDRLQSAQHRTFRQQSESRLIGGPEVSEVHSTSSKSVE